MDNRKYWLDMMIKIIDPVLENMSRRNLKARMPVEMKVDGREKYTYLEALGRTLTGIAPWLESDLCEGEEEELRSKYAQLAREAIDAATDPSSSDFCTFDGNERVFSQYLVDTGFLSNAIVRAPRELWEKLEGRVKDNLVRALKSTRKIRPPYCNWLLFSAMVETALYIMTGECDEVRIDYAIKEHEQWYKGDGVYGDGPKFVWNYYNSYVIQPMLVDIILIKANMYKEMNFPDELKKKILNRARRYSAVLERLISPDGTFPPLGRSITYRCGAFQLLAQMALKRELPDGLLPAQVRCALQAVIKKCFEAPGTFDENGWLKIGLYGRQPGLGEGYISTGSLYLCSTVFLPLGLSYKDEFWTDEDEKWTQQKIWSGEDIASDHAES
ncbi:MAG: DUF2264 domain-containing protein [Clostridiales bacterium]|nr:DUF2264 domain-containing protein [Clostridiales bacterium]